MLYRKNKRPEKMCNKKFKKQENSTIHCLHLIKFIHAYIYIYMLNPLHNGETPRTVIPHERIRSGCGDRCQWCLNILFLEDNRLKQTWQNVKVWQTGCWVRRYLLSYPADFRIVWSIFTIKMNGLKCTCALKLVISRLVIYLCLLRKSSRQM